MSFAYSNVSSDHPLPIGLSGSPPQGVVLIDKPQGWTSHDVVDWVRQQTGVKKVGHAGTLDPLATGLLIVLVGRQYTKQQASLMKLDKVYQCTAQLGVVTDTYDAAGQQIATVPLSLVRQLTAEQIISVLERYIGQTRQTVPAYSAVKIKGKKLYERARQGQLDEIDLPSRSVMISRLELTGLDLNSASFSIEVGCSSGTYIRSLVHDIGQDLKVGAHVTALCRTQIGSYRLQDIEKLNPSLVLPERNQ